MKSYNTLGARDSVLDNPKMFKLKDKEVRKESQHTEVWWEGLRDLGYQPLDYKQRQYKFVRNKEFGMFKSLFIWYVPVSCLVYSPSAGLGRARERKVRE